MTNKQALEIVYRKSCLPQKQPPIECSECPMAQESKCEIYQAYLQLTKLLDVVRILEDHYTLIDDTLEPDLILLSEDRAKVRDWWNGHHKGQWK